MGPKLIAAFGMAVLLSASAQNSSKSSLKVVALEPPVYPAAALAAHLSGEVNLKIALPENGVPAAVQVEGGPQMLRPAAVESAKRSKFESGAGGRTGESYQLVYRFVLDDTRQCNQERDTSYPRVKIESNIVTVSEQPVPLCDPGTERIRVRSWKCLYLWKCRVR